MAARTVAFEHRLAAVLATGGLFDLTSYTHLPEHLEKKIRKRVSEAAFNEAFEKFAFDPTTLTLIRWAIQQGISSSASLTAFL